MRHSRRTTRGTGTRGTVTRATVTRATAARRTAVLALAGLGAVAGLGACGGPSAPSKAAYAKQANAICASYNSKLSGIGSQLSSASSATAAEKALSSAYSVARQGASKLESLKQPSGSDTALKTALSDQQKQLGDLKALIGAIRSKDEAAARSAAASFTSIEASGHKAFAAAGVKTCGSGSDS